MPEKAKKLKEKKANEAPIVEESTKDAVVDEKEILREAEEREKERKELEEVERKEAKEAAKEAKKEESASKKAEKATVRKKPRHGKKYRAVQEKVEAGKQYSIDDACALVSELSTSSFKGSIDLHVKISKKQENVRGTLTLPGGAIKEKNIVEVTDKNVEEIVAKVKAGKIDFDVIVAHPAAMPKLAQLAKILGPRGLMPNPKSGTVAEDVKAAAEEFRGGRVEYKADKSNIVHMSVGKIGWDVEKIKLNIEAILVQFPTNRIDSVHLVPTMGPSIRVSLK